MNRKIGWIVLLAVFLTFAMFGCSKPNTSPEIADDEILLQIQLDIKEDIGLLVVNYEANGSDCSGSTSNANKSLLKHDELIYYTLSRESFAHPADGMDLTVQFTIITDYFDPNYDNIYPAEYTKPLNAIHFNVCFGKSYLITITGDHTNGYQAVLGQ